MKEDRNSAEAYLKLSANAQVAYCKALVNRIKISQADNVFEIGCGTGRFAAYLAENLVKGGTVTGCDPEEQRIQVAEETFAQVKNLSFINATGAKALENKESRYDAVYSNSVLHWMSKEEMVETLSNMFKAMKSGATGAHQVICKVPKHFLELLRFLNTEQQQEFHGMVRPIQLEVLVELMKHAGFEILDSGDSSMISVFDTVEEYMKFMDAATYGMCDFPEIYSKHKEEVEIDKMDDGKIKHLSDLVYVVIRKP